MKKVKKSTARKIYKALNTLVVLMMLVQPVGTPGLLRAMAADDPSTETVSAPAPAPDPALAPKEDPKTEKTEPTAPVVPKETPAPASAPAPDPAPAPVAEPKVEPTPIETPAPPNTIPADTASTDTTPAPATTLAPDGQTAPASDVQPAETPVVAPSTETATNPVPASEENGDLNTFVAEKTKASSVDLNEIDPTNVEKTAELATDKADYAPTDTAIITGTGFIPGQTYTLIITSKDSPPVTKKVSVTADENGQFVYAYQLDGNYRPDYTVEAKNDGGSVVADTTFTDGAVKVRDFSASISPTNSLPAETKTYTATFANSASSEEKIKSAKLINVGGFSSIGSFVLGGSASSNWTASLSGNEIKLNRTAPAGDIDTGQLFTVSFSATAPSTTGSKEWTAKAWETADWTDSAKEFNLTSVQPAVTVNKDNTTTSITSDTPDPSDINQSYLVNVSVARSGSSGTPSGTVTVFDGTDSCTDTTASGSSGTSTYSCSLTSTTAGLKTLTASYAGDTNFNTSSGTTSHTVNVDPTLPNCTSGDLQGDGISSTVDLVLTCVNAVKFASSGITTANGIDLAKIKLQPESDNHIPSSATISGNELTLTFNASDGTFAQNINIGAGVLANSTNISNDAISILSGSITDRAKPKVIANLGFASPVLANDPAGLAFGLSNTEGGSVTYGGGCTAHPTTVGWGNSTESLHWGTSHTFPDGVYNSCTITITDSSGNFGTGNVPTFIVDTTGPVTGTVTITPLYPNGGVNYISALSTISAPVTDAGTGINGATCEYTLNGISTNAGTLANYSAFSIQ